MNIILSALSGVLLALAFPKFDLYWLAWIALVPFFLALIRSRSLRERLVCGFFFGMVFFGIHLFWVTTLFRFVKWWIAAGWVSLVLFQTLYILLFAVYARVFLPRSTAGAGVLQAVELAVWWTFIEWLRAFGPFGVAGGDVGYSQAHFLPLIQIASFTTVYGVTFLVVLANASLALFLSNVRRWQPLVLTSVLVLGVAAYGSWVMSLSTYFSRSASPQTFALLQPNIDQEDKLKPALVPTIFSLHEFMTRQAAKEGADIIVWPESAIFSYTLRDPVLFPRLKKLAVESNAWLVFGTPHLEKGRAYNSVVSMSPQGEVVSRYDKEHRVPFGEYLPFRSILYPFLRGVGYYEAEFDSNPYPEPLRIGKLEAATAICFESTFPQVIRERVKEDSDLILLLTNDAWFNDSSALYFHLNAGIFRAIENRRYFVQVANTGISAVIDPYGRVLERSKVNERKILIYEMPML